MDATAFERMCRERRGALVAYAFACCGDRHRAEDIVQEAMTIAWTKHEQPLEDPGAWLLGIVRNVWFRERGRIRGTDRFSRSLPESADIFAAHVFGDDGGRACAALERCMERLSEDDRGLLRAHFAEGLTYQEIADRLQRSLSWVKVRMHRVRLALHACIQQRLEQEDRR